MSEPVNEQRFKIWGECQSQGIEKERIDYAPDLDTARYLVGEYTMERTWFSGYAWSYSICSSCYRHLGWHYSGPQNSDFHGLILDNLE